MEPRQSVRLSKPRQSARLASATAAAAAPAMATTAASDPSNADARQKKESRKKQLPSRKSSHQTSRKRVSVKRKSSNSSGTIISKRAKISIDEKSAYNTSTVGVVDPQSNITNGLIMEVENEPCDCMLIKLDPFNHSDVFYILQLIQCDDGTYVHSRWGRTGKPGKCLTKKFGDPTSAVDLFQKTFMDKTGLEWKIRGHCPVSGKYRFIQQNFTEKRGGYTSAKWQYWVDDGVDGKKIGWHDYDNLGSVNVEQLFQEFLCNLGLLNRFVESGHWTYLVDFSAMMQTNVKHHNRTSRHIRRCTDKETDDDSPPLSIIPPSFSMPGPPFAPTPQYLHPFLPNAPSYSSVLLNGAAYPYPPLPGLPYDPISISLGYPFSAANDYFMRRYFK